jgi:hypothetical protein
MSLSTDGDTHPRGISTQQSALPLDRWGYAPKSERHLMAPDFHHESEEKKMLEMTYLVLGMAGPLA